MVPLTSPLVGLFNTVINTERNGLKEKRFIFAHSFRVSSPSWWGGCVGVVMFTSWWPGSRE
jgi:hypothetical protein